MKKVMRPWQGTVVGGLAMLNAALSAIAAVMMFFCLVAVSAFMSQTQMMAMVSKMHPGLISSFTGEALREFAVIFCALVFIAMVAGFIVDLFIGLGVLGGKRWSVWLVIVMNAAAMIGVSPGLFSGKWNIILAFVIALAIVVMMVEVLDHPFYNGKKVAAEEHPVLKENKLGSDDKIVRKPTVKKIAPKKVSKPAVAKIVKGAKAKKIARKVVAKKVVAKKKK